MSHRPRRHPCCSWAEGILTEVPQRPRASRIPAPGAHRSRDPENCGLYSLCDTFAVCGHLAASLREILYRESTVMYLVANRLNRGTFLFSPRRGGFPYLKIPSRLLLCLPAELGLQLGSRVQECRSPPLLNKTADIRADENRVTSRRLPWGKISRAPSIRLLVSSVRSKNSTAVVHFITPRPHDCRTSEAQK